ncbi:hypothetical protein EVAR_34687_1 [Eumeta japonica]|uniref:Uncharacterized protein n=1 Tax=Eumeta variegata TaxID=151549 RepID=A0A4C1XEP2_EUMVA|nr:hypothetical protein EVAR_34687_1 [Eumeta japonica]
MPYLNSEEKGSDGYGKAGQIFIVSRNSISRNGATNNSFDSARTTPQFVQLEMSPDDSNPQFIFVAKATNLDCAVGAKSVISTTRSYRDGVSLRDTDVTKGSADLTKESADVTEGSLTQQLNK